MKFITGILMIAALTSSVAFRSSDLFLSVNKPGGQHQTKKWEVLFDGKNVDKWRKAAVDSVPSKGWIIENGTLSVLKGRKGGDIITRETYSSFELEAEFNLTPGSNSGIKYLVNPIENAKSKKFSPMGIEYQIIDDKNYPETAKDPDGLSSTASAYLIYPPKGKKLMPAGQWNKMRIVVKGKHTEHWLNGVKVTEYERGSDDFNQRVALTKFKDYPQYAKSDTGHIMLTDHGDQVYYKNIRIRRL
jgi:hypothetical protein